MMLRSIARRARTMVGVYYALMLEYRAEILLWALAGLFPLMLMGVWMQASAASGGSIQGKTPVDFARYFMSVFIIGQFTTVWVIYEFEYEVVEGRLSPALLMPQDPVWRHVASHVAERATRLPWIGLFIVIFALLYPKAAWFPGWKNLALCAAATAMAFVLRFAMQYTFALGSFWVERSSAIEQMTFLLNIFLSGRIAPLDLYPPWVAQAAMWTPFPYIVYFPVALLLGDERVNIPRGFAMLAGWTIVFLVVNRVMWHRGLRRYSAMGA